MMEKGKELVNVLKLKCPKCREGELFVNRSAYKKGLAELHSSCPNCGENFKREPGFYFGAAYVSYGLTIALWVSLYVALVVFDLLGWMSFSFANDTTLFLVLGVLLLLAVLPLVYRLSRSIWINMFVKYDSKGN